MPVLFPEVEHLDGLCSPPPAPPAGLSMWLVPTVGQPPPGIDEHDRAGLAALGYLK
jgi:hypothetical protein